MKEVLTGYPIESNVHYLSVINREFEDLYLEARKKEKRIYTREELLNLPWKSNNHTQEWEVRAETANYFLKYLQSSKPKRILEVGCGNGWFANQIVKHIQAEVYALDLNEFELKQGANTFTNDGLKFLYSNIFDDTFDLFQDVFDLIFFAGSIQYFEHLDGLINRMSKSLNKNGEIHFLDSQFYSSSEQPKAKQRSLDYYKNLGIPEMADHYYHHKWDDLQALNHHILYKPSRFKKVFGGRKSPFPWIRVTPNK